MFRQLILAALIVAIVGVALLHLISGLLYIFLACSAALLSVLFVRTGHADEREVRRSSRARVAPVKRFPAPSDAVLPPAPTYKVGRVQAGR
jgi:hypothetical protein